MQQTSEQRNRARKALLYAPLMLVPLILLMAYALGVGKGTTEKKPVQQGLNTSVPEPRLSDNPLDKLALYRKADKDSAQREKLLRADPLFGQQKDADHLDPEWMEQYERSREPRRTAGKPEDAERRVRDKISRLEEQLARSTETDVPRTPPATPPPATISDAELAALQDQIQQASSKSTDTEITAINEMLKNVLDVQHPELVRDRLRSEAPKRVIYPVSTSDHKEWSVRLGEHSRPGDTIPRPVVFNNLSSADTTASVPNAIRAEVFGTQEVVSGASVTLQLSQDVFVRGQRVSKGTLLSGTGTLSGDRYSIEISKITIGQVVLPVRLSVLDLQGMPGILISGAINRDVAARQATSAVQGMPLMSLDPSIQSQAISAGIETAKGLFSKRAKLVKSTLKAGHPVLLLDDSSR